MRVSADEAELAANGEHFYETLQDAPSTHGFGLPFEFAGETEWYPIIER